MKEGLERDWIKLREFLLCNIQQCREDKTKSRGWDGSKAIVKGIERVFRDRGNVVEDEKKRKQEIPLPPAEVPPNKQLRMIIKRDIEGGGFLKRGEKRGPVNSRYDIDVAIGWKEDKTEIIGRALYGCRGRDSFIYRSIVKYLDTYEKEEKFRSRYIRKRQGGFRKINSFIQYREALLRRNFLLGKNELEILTRLYQVQIRIFKEARNNDSNMICIEQIGQEYDRIVNILSKQGRWALICIRGQERTWRVGRGRILEEEEEEKRVESNVRTERGRGGGEPVDKETRTVEGEQKYENRMNSRLEEGDRANNRDRHQKDKKEKTERRREMQKGKGEGNVVEGRVEQDILGIGTEDRQEEKKRETVGDSIERQDSIDKQVDNEKARAKEQEVVLKVDRIIDREREEEIAVRKDRESTEYDKVRRGGEEKSSTVEDLEDSPIELLDRRKLDRCLVEYVEETRREEEEEKRKNRDIEREKEGEKYENRINNRQEEGDRINNADRHHKEKERGRGRKQGKGEGSRLGQVNPRIGIEDRQEEKKKEIEGGNKERQDSIDKQVDIVEVREKEQEEVLKVDRKSIDRGREKMIVIEYDKVVSRGEEDKSIRVEESEDSPLELLDRGKLDRCLAEYVEEIRRKDREEEEKKGTNRDIEIGKEGEKYEHRINNRQEERDRVNNTDKEKEGKIERRRGIQQTKGAKQDTLRIGIEDRQGEKKKETEGGSIERQDSIDKQVHNEEAREKEQIKASQVNRIDRGREEETIVRKDIESRKYDKVESRGEEEKNNIVEDSEDSPIELLDRGKLDRCLAEYIRKKDREEEEEKGMDRDIEREKKEEDSSNIDERRGEGRKQERWRAEDIRQQEDDRASNIDRRQREREAKLVERSRIQQRYEVNIKLEERGIVYDILRTETKEEKGVGTGELARQGSKDKQEVSEGDRLEKGRVEREKKNKEKATQGERTTIDSDREEKLEESRDRESREHDTAEGRGEETKGISEDSPVELLDREKLDRYLAEHVERMNVIDREQERTEEKMPGEIKAGIKKGEISNNIRGKREEERQMEGGKAGGSDTVSNGSSIELLDMRELDRWLANNMKRLRIERGEGKGESGVNRESDVEGEVEGGVIRQVGGESKARRGEKTVDIQGGRSIDNKRDSIQHRWGGKGKERKDTQKEVDKENSESIEQIERRKEENKEEGRGRRKILYKGRKVEKRNNTRNRGEEEEIQRKSALDDNHISRWSDTEREAGRSNKRGIWNEKTSDSSEIEWTERHKENRSREEKREKRRGERIREGGRRGNEVGGNNGNTRDRRKKKEKQAEKKQPTERRQHSLGTKEGEEGERERERSISETTTSSIAALFRDKHLEREGKKVGRKRITRRKVWERWKGIVRGAIRRGIKKKAKLQRTVEREKQDRQLVFDYTTQGLTVEEMKLLGRGEGFCVIDHKIDEDKTKVDIYHFQRRIRLHEMFREGYREEEQGELEIGTLGTVALRRERESRQSRVSIIGRVHTQETTSGRRGNVESTIVGRERRQSNVGRVSSTPTRSEIRQRDGGRGSRGRLSGREERLEVDINTPRTTRRGRNGRLSTVGRGIGERRFTEERRENRGDVGETGRGGRQEVYGRHRIQEGRNRENRIDIGGEVSTVENRRNTIGEGARDRRVSIVSGNERERDRGIEQKEKGRRLPSMYDPESKNRSLNRYNTCIQEEILLGVEDKKIKFRDNISKEERIALRALKKRIEEKEIIITRADKGSGLVAIDYEMYIKKGTKYIEEEVGAYNKVQESQQCIINRITKERNKIAEQLKEKGVIMVQTATYIKKQLEEKITGIKFYYKIHKDKNIDTMPLRPLQSCIKAPIHHLSIVLTDILQPLLTDKNISTFIFDSNQLLYRLQNLGNIPDNCTLVSSDVSALYPSIPHREGFRAMKLFLEEKTEYNEEQIREIIAALKLVITENYMTWNNQIYKQISGVVMGTPVAVAYANIFMNWVDGEVKRGAPYIYEHFRFIDDNLFIVPKDRVIDMIEVANNVLVPHIKFTYEKLEDQVGKGLPFLDTQLFITEEKKIESRLYTKSTDRHAYLLPSSFHPAHITQNIPMAVFGRIRKLCSKDEWFREDAEKAEGWLLNRGYKQIEIQKAIEKTSKRDRWSMIEQIEKNRDSKGQKKEGEVVDIPLIITYNQHGKKVKKILKDRQPLLDAAFSKTRVRPRLSYRRKRNLNDLIVQKGLRGPIEDKRKELNIFSRCGERPGYRSRCPCRGRHNQEQCRCCMHSKEGIEGVESKIYKPANCNSKNIIYVIGCNTCGKKYVGETQQRLKDRLAQHMYNVDKQNQPLYLHFRHVHKLENLYIVVVETVRGEEPFMRKVREAWWINQLRTLEPNGFNIKLECNQAYEEVRD